MTIFSRVDLPLPLAVKLNKENNLRKSNIQLIYYNMALLKMHLKASNDSVEL